MTEKEKMLAGRLYISYGKELFGERQKVKRVYDKVNNDWHLTIEEKQTLIKSIIGSYGDNFYMEAPVRFDYGYNLHVGKNFYANFDCIFLDGNRIEMGDNVMLGPRVSLYTASHPIDKDVRSALYEFSKPIKIGNDVWIGGGTTVNPGVTIGSNVVIGSGSVVTKDIPSNVVAAGNPCKVIRTITNSDKKKWETLLNEENAQ